MNLLRATLEVSGFGSMNIGRLYSSQLCFPHEVPGRTDIGKKDVLKLNSSISTMESHVQAEVLMPYLHFLWLPSEVFAVRGEINVLCEPVLHAKYARFTCQSKGFHSQCETMLLQVRSLQKT